MWWEGFVYRCGIDSLPQKVYVLSRNSHKLERGLDRRAKTPNIQIENSIALGIRIYP
jgi:hypothetical protein